MLFNLEEDTGERVRGYVVPDGFSGVPSIRICGRGGELALRGLWQMPGDVTVLLANPPVRQFSTTTANALPPTPQFPTVAPLADTLRESGAVDVILEKDLELYHYIESAAHKAP